MNDYSVIKVASSTVTYDHQSDRNIIRISNVSINDNTHLFKLTDVTSYPFKFELELYFNTNAPIKGIGLIPINSNSEVPRLVNMIYENDNRIKIYDYYSNTYSDLFTATEPSKNKWYKLVLTALSSTSFKFEIYDDDNNKIIEKDYTLSHNYYNNGAAPIIIDWGSRNYNNGEYIYRNIKIKKVTS